jgi:23S rRNA (uracil1939-C5)-methyltransferase
MTRAVRGVALDHLAIAGLTDNGRPYGMSGALKVHVDKSVPGEIVSVTVVKPFRGNRLHGEGRLEAVIRPSPERIEPACRHYTYCGGCQWQHVTYAEQLRLKEQLVKSLLENVAPGAEFLPIVPSDVPYRFRNRITYTFSNRRWLSPEELGNSALPRIPAAGFARKGRFDKVMAIDDCHLADIFSNRLMHVVRDTVLGMGQSFYDPMKERGFLRSLTVRRNGEDQYMVILGFGEEDLKVTHALSEKLCDEFPQITSLWAALLPRRTDDIVRGTLRHISGNHHLRYRLAGLTFRIGPKSFFQTHTGQAEKLYRIAIAWAGLTGSETVYDLYTGSGTISAVVAGLSSRVVGIDAVAEAITDARKNAEDNNIGNTEFIAGDLKETMQPEFFARHGRPDVIFTDPPQAGMHREVLSQLLVSGARRIVYISCNPVTQRRDVQALSSAYRLVRSQAVDMFPQTAHLENIVLLELREQAAKP